MKSVKLADKVSKAKVYKTGKHRYEADIWAKGVKSGTLHANGKPAHARNNGLHVTLHPSGKVTSWAERAKPKPVVKHVLVATAPLADGTSTAKIYKLTAGPYRADVFAGGTKTDTLDADGRAAHGEYNGLHVALQPDGRLSSWVDQTPTPDPTPQPDETDPVVPVDPVVPNGTDMPDAQPQDSAALAG